MSSFEDKNRNRKIEEYMGGVFVPKADLWDLTADRFFTAFLMGLQVFMFQNI